MTNNSETIAIINPDASNDYATRVTDLTYEMFPNKKIALYKTSTHFIFLTEFYGKFSNKKKISQEEFPIESINWIIEHLEYGAKNLPLKKPTTPGDVTVFSTFKEENIGLSPSRHCCAENNPGYSLWNKSRLDHITGLAPQTREIPRDIILSQIIPALELCK